MLIKIAKLKFPDRQSAPKDLINLMESLKEIGLKQPILISRNYKILDGVSRVIAARRLNWSEIECRVIE